jgi:AcrR family transcriptional regulator
MAATQTARDRARAELTSEIKAEARRQLAAGGAPQLSLRAVARELGMASSALYRYFPSRDDLLTALIIDAYDALGQQAERADAALPQASSRARWRACCHAVRGWAIEHPHEYALIYGSPVPGYQAPRQTVAPAARVAAVFGGVLRDATAAAGTRLARGKAAVAGPAAAGPGTAGPAAAGPGTAGPAAAGPGTAGPAAAGPGEPPAELLPQPLASQAELVGEAIAPGVPAAVIARALISWTQLFGMVSFELSGQFAGSADPADAFFSYAVDQMADYVGLPR